MTVFEALILGLAQGLTEFLPVSSSAHLVLIPEFFNIPAPGIAFNVLLHVGTLVAVVGYFIKDLIKIVVALVMPKRLRKDEVRYWRRLFLWLVIGTVPAGIIGLALNDFFEGLFGTTAAVGIFLLVTTALLLGTDLAGRYAARRQIQGASLKDMRPVDAIIIGFFQALAIAPGISRSGATISAGIFLGFDRETAARFAFLLSAPAILGAFLVKLPDLGGETGPGGAAMLVGFIAAVVSGFLAVRFMMNLIKKRRLWGFAIYTFVLGVFVIVLSLA